MPLFAIAYVAGNDPQYLPDRYVEWNGRRESSKPQYPVLIESHRLNLPYATKHWLVQGGECYSGTVEVRMDDPSDQCVQWDLVESRLSVRVGDVVMCFHLDHVARPDVEKTRLGQEKPR